MVKRLSMDSQDKRMFMVESGVSGTTIDYNNHRVSDEDCFGDILNMFDLPMENLEGDCLVEDWASKLGPIPSEIGVANNLGYSMDLPFECHMPIYKTYQQQYHQNHGEETSKTYQNIDISQLKQHPPPYDENNKLYPSQPSFQAPSPNSVLENRASSSNNKGVSFGIEISIPIRTRTKRLKPTANPWLMSPLLLLPNKDKKRKKTTKNLERSEVVGIKKCSHCEITKTPQWREGPMGPKTLCNACGVRYRSGRLYPEYRPAASPTFVPSLHSNSHRKVIEMRQKVVK